MTNQLQTAFNAACDEQGMTAKQATKAIIDDTMTTEVKQELHKRTFEIVKSNAEAAENDD